MEDDKQERWKKGGKNPGEQGCREVGRGFEKTLVCALQRAVSGGRWGSTSTLQWQ